MGREAKLVPLVVPNFANGWNLLRVRTFGHMFARSSKGFVLFASIRKGFGLSGTFVEGSDKRKWLQIETISELAKWGRALLVQAARAHA